MKVRVGGAASSGYRLWLALALSSVLLPVQAAVIVDPRNAIPITLVWNNQNIVVTQDFCVQSTGANSPNATEPVINYSVTAAAPFALASGANQVPGTVQYQDLVSGVVTTLAPNAASGDIMTGKAPGCPGGNNGRAIISFSLAALTAVPPGTYTRSLVMTFSNANPGGPNNRTASLDMTLVIPDTVRVSQLNTIDLGTFSNVDLVAQDSLCVFRASGLGYGVTVTGSGPGGVYALTNGQDQLPFSVTWNDGAGAVTLSSGVLLSGRVNSFTGNNHCNNGASNNATLGVNVTVADIDANAATSGDYSGVLTILIEMQ